MLGNLVTRVGEVDLRSFLCEGISVFPRRHQPLHTLACSNALSACPVVWWRQGCLLLMYKKYEEKRNLMEGADGLMHAIQGKAPPRPYTNLTWRRERHQWYMS